MTRTFRKLLLATSAVTMIGYAGAASAQSSIDASTGATAGAITIAAGLEAMMVGNSQIGVTTDATTNVTGTVTTDVTGGVLTTPQTNVNSVIETLSRLNQATNTVQGDVTTPGTAATGAVSITPGTSVTANVGAGIVSFQDIQTTLATATNTNGAVTTTVDGTSINQATTVASSRIVADALANDVSNSVNVTGTGGALGTQAAIASLQNADGLGAVEATIATGASVGAVMGTTGLLADGTVTVSGNVVGARAGLNQAANELVVGNGSAASGLNSGNGIEAASLTGFTGDVASFDADYAIANSQVATLTGGVTSTIDGFGVGASLAAATAVAANVSVLGNQVTSDAVANSATNRLVASVDSINPAVAAVGSVQSNTGTDVTSTITTGALGIGDATFLAIGGVMAANTTFTVADNTVSATAVSNRANNVLGLNSSGGMAGSIGAVAGNQYVDTVTANASVTAADVGAFTSGSAPTSAVDVLNNQVLASAALNSQTNLVVGSGATGYSPASLVATNTQYATASTSTATIGDGNIAGLSAAGDVSVTAANNTIKAMASANVATNTVANTSRSFSFGR